MMLPESRTSVSSIDLKFGDSSYEYSMLKESLPAEGTYGTSLLPEGTELTPLSSEFWRLQLRLLELIRHQLVLLAKVHDAIGNHRLGP